MKINETAKFESHIFHFPENSGKLADRCMATIKTGPSHVKFSDCVTISPLF